MLGCFNPILGKIWTNPAIGLNYTFLNYIFKPMAGFVHILLKIGLKQPIFFLECNKFMKMWKFTFQLNKMNKCNTLCYNALTAAKYDCTELTFTSSIVHHNKDNLK